jgi:hypothetical protein
MKNMGMIRLAVAVCVAAGLSAVFGHTGTDAYELGGSLAVSLDSWDQSADDFVVDRGQNGFRFVDNRRRDVALSAKRGAVTFFGERVMETRVYFQRRAVERIELSLYNKGDAVAHGVKLPFKNLDGLIQRVSEKLNGGTRKMPPVTRVRVKNDRMDAGHKYTIAWPKRVPAAELSWGVSGEDEARVVEYVKVTLTREKTDGAARTGVSARRPSKKGSGWQANVKRNDEGDLYVANVPMVDQGAKGYCAAATAERVLRYFGQTIDEHEIAQIAATSAKNGTSAKAMISAVETIGKKCRLGKREIVAKLSNWEDAEKLIKAYNKAAKRLKREPLNIADYIKTDGRQRVFHVAEMERAMEAKVLKAMAMRDTAGYGKFIKGIREQTKRGVPLFWSVRLGLYPEAGIPQTAGGHVRLIIGYNEEKGEVIYSDSWGAGHERKYMPDDWAWTITHNLFYLNPR